MLNGFGKWMTKLGAALVLLPPVMDAVYPAVGPKGQAIIQAVGAVLALFGIRRATATVAKQNAVILENQGMPAAKQPAAVENVDTSKEIP